MVSITECSRAIMWSIDIYYGIYSDTLATYGHVSDLCYATLHKMCCFKLSIVRRGHKYKRPLRSQDDNQYLVYEEAGWSTYTFVLLGDVHRTFDLILDKRPLSLVI